MGLFSKLKAANAATNGKPASLPLISPRLHLPLGLHGGPAVLVYVVDGWLTRGSECARAHELAAAVVAAGEAPADHTSEELLLATLRSEITQAEPLREHVDVVTASFVARWSRLGHQAALVERDFGAAVFPDSISSVTSSALVGTTLDIKPPVEAFFAQYAMRWGYTMERSAGGASPIDTRTAASLPLEPRLYVLSASGPGPETVYSWFTSAPFPSYMRDPVINKVASTLDLVEFLELVQAANGMIWQMGTAPAK